MARHLSEGSVWKRWDLHLHAPGSKLSNSYGDASSENLERYVRVLEESPVQAFGITDYFSFDSYWKVKDAYERIFPNSQKLLIPNIEFRLTETVSSDARSVHSHVLLDPDSIDAEKLDRFLTLIPTHVTRNDAQVFCRQLSSEADFTEATVSQRDIKKVLASVFGDPTHYMFVTAANNDGLRGVDTNSPRSLSISDELDKASHGFFGSSNNVDYFMGSDRYESDEESEAKPVYSGSDAHSFEDLSRLSGQEPGFRPTWIKADLTFRGLRQTLFEPKARVHIGELPSVLLRQQQDATNFIHRLQISKIDGYDGENGSWFESVDIPINPELTAIIGNKGSGKSAVADIIGLLSDSKQQQHFSFLTDGSGNKKFKQKGFAENFEAELFWLDGASQSKSLNSDADELMPERVKYLPQNYFENLTNEIEVSAFRQEIEEVVFSHVDDADKVGKATFDELQSFKTAQSKSEISALKVQLRELNHEICDLEKRASVEERTRLSSLLDKLKSEHLALEKSKPTKVDKPEGASAEQADKSEQIEALRSELNGIEAQGKSSAERLGELKTEVAELSSLRESILSVQRHVDEQKNSLREICERYELEVDKLISLEVDLKALDKRIEFVSKNIADLDEDFDSELSDTTDLSVLHSVKSLRAAYNFISKKIEKIQESLSAPHRRYETYVRRISEIDVMKSELMGDLGNPKPGTINELKKSIDFIDKNIQKQIDDKHAKREATLRQIFEQKEKVKTFYESLKTSVESRLADVSSAEFKVTIDASFVPDHNLATRLLEHINQNTKGPFMGKTEGYKRVSELTSDIDWNDIESILAFIKEVLAEIKTEDESKQVKDKKRFLDFLFSLEYFDSQYDLRLGGKNLNLLSPGEKGLLLLVFYLHLDKERTPLIIDQPEDNLDNDSIFSVLASCIREAKKGRQVILVTHNPNLAVGADAEQIIHVNLDKAQGYKFTYNCGAIENPKINAAVVKVLEGSRPAFVQRRLKYQIR